LEEPESHKFKISLKVFTIGKRRLGGKVRPLEKNEGTKGASKMKADKPVSDSIPSAGEPKSSESHQRTEDVPAGT